LVYINYSSKNYCHFERSEKSYTKDTLSKGLFSL
jgi:hypothetical protein